MGGRVALVDVWGELADIEPALTPCGVRCEKLDALPAGGGVLGLVVGTDHDVDAAAVARLPDLRCVATASTGYDHLDLEALAAAGVWATNVASYCDEEVADHTIALVLDLLRGVSVLDRDVRAGGWDFTRAHPRRIAGTVLGLVGLGRIASAVATRGSALGMRVLAFDPFLADDGNA